MHLAELDAAAASSRAFELLTLKGGAVVYAGGAVERELEEISEAADAFLDLAAGRPLMTARVAPLPAATALPRPPPLRPSIGTPRAALRLSIHMSVESSATGMTTGVSGVDDERKGGSEAGEMPSESTPPPERLFPEELNLVYDSKCGVCQWEVDFLRSRDRDGKLTYTDLEGADFEEGAARNGYLDYEAALASFHAIRSDGEVLSGMRVFQEAYAAVGLGWVWRVYNNLLAARLLDFGYRLFARYRTDLTRGQSLQTLYEARRAARAAATDCERCAASASSVENTSS